LRGLIKPPEGWGICYVDWSQQEFGIAAVLSGDEVMQAAYRSGDPYLASPSRRAWCRPTPRSRATALCASFASNACWARDLLRAHRETYRKFWAWSDAPRASSLTDSSCGPTSTSSDIPIVTRTRAAR